MVKQMVFIINRNFKIPYSTSPASVYTLVSVLQKCQNKNIRQKKESENCVLKE